MSNLVRRTRLVGLAGALLASSLLAAAPPELSPEQRAERTEQVRAAENAFAASVQARDRAAFAAWIADDAAFVSGSDVSHGRDAVVADWAVFFAEGGPTIEWHPEIVELTADGTLGLTRGPWTLRGKNAQGEPVERSGVFNSVWRRQADGSWRVTFDAGCSPCPKCGG